jgi:hypothetical protein
MAAAGDTWAPRRKPIANFSCEAAECPGEEKLTELATEQLTGIRKRSTLRFTHTGQAGRFR